MKAIVVTASLVLASPAFAANTLCTPDETVVFSCATGATGTPRYVSVCASKDVSKTGGYMQYRFGQPSKLDIVFPDKKVPPAGQFTPGNLMFSGGGGSYLQFGRGGYRYTVFSAIGNWNPKGGKAEVQGVAVSNNGKELANLSCRKGADLVPGELGPDFFSKAGLGESAMDFEIPDAFFPK